MRILIVTPLLPPESGGPSYYAVGLAGALKNAGHEVDTIAFREVRKYPTGIRHLLFLYLVLWRGLRADAFIILDTVSVALPAVIAGWFLFKKMVIRTGGDFVWEHYVERTKEKVLLSEFYTAPRALSSKEKILIWLQKHIIFRLAHTIVFSTEWQRAIWKEPYGIPENKTVVIKNAFESQPPLASSTRTKTVLWVGRDLVLKNAVVLDTAFAQARQRCPDLVLEKLINASHDEVMEKLATAMCLVLPSVSEVSPNIVLEALSLGTPVICTQDCGLKDDLGDAAHWVDSCDVDDIANALCDVARGNALSTHSNLSVRIYDDIAYDFTTLVNR